MYARLTFIDIDPRDIKEVSTVYNFEVAPVIKKFQGVAEVMLLEPTDGSGELISVTTWHSKADAEAYERSGTYQEMVDKVKAKIVKPPVLQTYNVHSAEVSVI